MNNKFNVEIQEDGSAVGFLDNGLLVKAPSLGLLIECGGNLLPINRKEESRSPKQDVRFVSRWTEEELSSLIKSIKEGKSVSEVQNDPSLTRSHTSTAVRVMYSRIRSGRLEDIKNKDFVQKHMNQPFATQPFRKNNSWRQAEIERERYFCSKFGPKAAGAMASKDSFLLKRHSSGAIRTHVWVYFAKKRV